MTEHEEDAMITCNTCNASMLHWQFDYHTCPRCNKADESVLLDQDGEPYLCDECWEADE